MLIAVEIIYADSLIALNLAADYLLLLAAGRLSGAALRRRRILLAAALGAVYALASVAPGWGFVTHPALKIAAGVGTSLVAYGRERRFWRCCAMFFAVSALFGGAVWAAALFAGYDAAAGLYVPVSFRVLALSFAACYAAVTLFLRRGLRAARRRVRLDAALAGRSVSLAALADTGCSLADPATGRQAAVCDAAALGPLLGAAPEAKDPVLAAAEPSLRPSLAGRVLLIPYKSVGSRGMLAAVRPDSACVDGEKRELLLAIAPEPLGGGYEAIVPV